MIVINNFIAGFLTQFAQQPQLQPWEITGSIENIVAEKILLLDNAFHIKDGIAIHKTATIEPTAILKAPVIINENCFVASNACLRNGVYLAKNVKIGIGCEIKSSIVFNNSSIAHFNFIGDSIIGNNVNFEAGAIAANHFNERTDKKITLFYNDEIILTSTEKFGALVGDNSTIGANAVLSPGTILSANTVVKRLELVDQQK